MKKILVVFLVLAVAGGVFAQDGNWSLSGQAIVGARMDFDPDPSGTVDPDPALIWGTDYWYPYAGWDDDVGKLGLAYNGFQGLSLGVTFSWVSGLYGDVQYDGENFKYQTKANLTSAFIQGNGDFFGNVDRLWGSYLLMNIVTLEAATNARDNQWWTSDLTAGFLDWNYGHWSKWPEYAGRPWFSGNNGDVTLEAFTHVDHNSMILIDVGLENLSFGLQMKNFTNKDAVYTGDRKLPGNKELVEDVLKKMVFGIKFELSPIEVAAQFLMENYGVYLGGKFFIGPVTVGASFMGILNDPVNGQHIKAGVDVGYKNDMFTAGIIGYYDVQDANKDGTDYQSRIAFEPRFCYYVIPTHLSFAIDGGFYFVNTYYDKEKSVEDSDVIWAFQPQLWWNFLGTGAAGPGGYWGFGTGMIIRYRVVKEEVNALDVVFKWSF